jgi:heme exporter protein D
MFLLLFIVLLAAWLLGYGAFHVAGGLNQLLLTMAIIALIVHFVHSVRRRRARFDNRRREEEKQHDYSG